MSAKLVMCGTHISGYHTIEHLLENGVQFDHFVLVHPDKAERLGISGFARFEPLAERYNIPVHYVEKYTLQSEKDQAFFEQHQFDLLVQGGWQRLFPETVLNTLRVGAIGGHGSSEYLPKGRGRSPLNWSLIEGKERFIMHYFLIKPGVDDGDVFYRKTFDINPWDDINTLYYKISLVTRQAMIDWIPRLLDGDYEVVPQEGEPTYYPKRSPEDGKIDWTTDVHELYNFVRAQTKPYPGAFFVWKQQHVHVWKAQPFDTQIDYPDAAIGQVVASFSQQHLVVKVNGGLLLITAHDATGQIPTGTVLT